MSQLWPNRRELKAAADWLAQLDAGFALGTLERFKSWLAADCRNAGAWREIEFYWTVYDRARGADRAARILPAAAKPRRSPGAREKTNSGTADVPKSSKRSKRP